METTSAALLISISLVVFGISYYYFTTRHKERMELLERGLAADYFKPGSKFLPLVLVLGMGSIGTSLGILAGISLDGIFPGQKLLLISCCVFAGLGIALIAGYYLLSKKPSRP